MIIDPQEREIIGSWILEDGRMTEDETCKRIELLCATELDKMSISKDGWEKLYRDPKDGRLWEHTYPRSEMHGGGPPALIVISSSDAVRKYNLPG